MRLFHRIAFAATLVATSTGAAPRLMAQAQTSGTRFGAEIDYADHFDLGVGAFVKFHLADMNAHPVTGRVSFDWYFPGSYGYDYDCGFDVCSGSYSQHYFQISADGLYDIASKGSVKPYVGAGLELAHYSVSDNNCAGCDFGGTGGIGLNIMGGLNFMADSRLMPFVELKVGLAGSVGAYGGTVLTIKGGVHFK